MVRVTVPPGCYGLDLDDGRKAHTRGRPYVEVDESAARTIRKSWYGAAGVVSGVEPHILATRATRWCRVCTPAGRRWNAWNDQCPRCGAPTTSDQEKP